ncbi:uncharacterized protein P884DRAFT_290516 [Thermothelomyces heterothallicus CBS 202.75]|uniref:uncharacterized protein n=1 Tax=Thermothelomyces heterothallicus CBS 202.75 TaxID=1149848 RepID=UPI0037434100
MNPTNHPLNLIEYVWPCGHQENVEVQQAPGIPFVRGQFSLPVAKSPEEFTEEERIGVPGRRKCCRCWATSSLFKPLEACKECDHPFAGCHTCMIVDSSGTREIATLERRPIGEFDQTPEYWRCGTCEHVNAFDRDGPINGFLAPMVPDYMEDMECRKCGGPFTEDSWVINPFWVYLGTWNGRVVAEGGPWHWSLEWHRDCAGEQHTKDDCYGTRKNGRRRRENPCVKRHFAADGAQKKGPEEPSAKPPIPPIMVIDTDRHSLPPPSAGLTPFPEDHEYGDSDRETVPPEVRQEGYLQPDYQAAGTDRFTIGDYASDDYEEDNGEYRGERGLEDPGDYQEPDLGSYYDAPAGCEEVLDESERAAGDERPFDAELLHHPTQGDNSAANDHEGDSFILGEDEDFTEAESEFSYVDDGHTTIPYNTYAILDTPAAAAYNPPGMIHDLSWESEDEEDGDGEAEDGLEAVGEDAEQQSIEGEDREGSLEGADMMDGEVVPEEEERQLAEEEGEGVPEDGEVPENDPAEEEAALEDGERGLGDDDLAEEEELADREGPVDEELPDGDQFGEEPLEAVEDGIPDEEALEGERSLDVEEGEFAAEDGVIAEDGELDEGGFPEDGDYAEEGNPEGAENVAEMEEGMEDGGERGLDDEFLPEGEAEFPVQDAEAEEFLHGDGEAPPEDGEFPPEGEREILPEEEGEVPPEGEVGFLPEEGGEFPPEGELPPEGEFPPEGEGEFLPEGEREFLPEEGELPPEEGDELPQGEPVLGEEFANGEQFADGEQPLNGEFTDGDFPSHSLPQDDLAAGEFPGDGYADGGYPGDGERGFDENLGGQPVDGGFVDDGLLNDGQPPGGYDNRYPDDNYAGDGYPTDNYAGDGYPTDNYAGDGYPADNYNGAGSQEPPPNEEPPFDEQPPLEEPPLDGPPPIEEPPFDERPPFDEPPPLDDRPPINESPPLNEGPPLDEGPPFDDGPPFDSGPPLDDRPPLNEGPPLDNGPPFDEGPPLDDQYDQLPINEPLPLDNGPPFDDGPPLDDQYDQLPINEPLPLDNGPPFDEEPPLDDQPPIDESLPLDDGQPFDDGPPINELPPLDDGPPFNSGPPLDDRPPVEEPPIDDGPPFDDRPPLDDGPPPDQAGLAEEPPFEPQYDDRPFTNDNPGYQPPIEDQQFVDSGMANVNDHQMDGGYPQDDLGQTGGIRDGDDGMYSGAGYGDDPVDQFTNNPPPEENFPPGPGSSIQDNFHDQTWDNFDNPPQDFQPQDQYPQDNFNDQPQDFQPGDEYPPPPVDGYNDQQNFPSEDQYPQGNFDQHQDFQPEDQYPLPPVGGGYNDQQNFPPGDQYPQDNFDNPPQDFQPQDQYPQDNFDQYQDFQPEDQYPPPPVGGSYNDQQNFPPGDQYPQSPIQDHNNYEPYHHPFDDQIQEPPMDSYNTRSQEYLPDGRLQEQPMEEYDTRTQEYPVEEQSQGQSLGNNLDTPYLRSSESQHQPGFEDKYNQDPRMAPGTEPPAQYYDPDNPTPYQPNEPMEMTWNSNGGQHDEFMTAAQGLRRNNGHEKDRYRWLLPVTVTATLGWGMEALEEQYHAGNIKASGFSFKAIAAKLFGSKTKKDRGGDKDAQKFGAAGGVEREDEMNPTRPQEMPDPGDEMSEPNNQDHTNNAMQNAGPTDQDGEWEDIDENEPVDNKKGKGGLFSLFRKRKKEPDLEAQDQEFLDGQEPGISNDGQDANAPLGRDGYADEQYPADQTNIHSDPKAKQKKRGFLTALFGSKEHKTHGAEAMDAGDMGQGMNQGGYSWTNENPDMTRTPDLARRERMSQYGSDQYYDGDGSQNDNPKPERRGFLATLFGSKRPKRHGQDIPGSTEEYPTETLPERDPYSADTMPQEQYDSITHSPQMTKKPKRKSIWAALFGRRETRTQPDEITDSAMDTNHGDREYPMGSLPGEQTYSQGSIVPHGDDGNNGPEWVAQKPEKKGFWATIFGSKKSDKSRTLGNADSEELDQTQQRKGGLFARAQTASQQNRAERRAKTRKTSFFSRLFGRKQQKDQDIEMGNLNDSDEARIGHVRTGSPQLHHGESGARRSATADVMGNDGFEDVPDKKRRKRDKEDRKKRSQKERNKKQKMGLFHRASLASSSNTGNKENGNGKKTRQNMVHDENGNVVARPRGTRKSRAKVRYAPTPPGKNMNHYVNRPKLNRNGKKKPLAAAANPKNWFWIDVYWK